MDVVFAVALSAAIEILAWHRFPIGDPIAGPKPLVAALPLLMAVPQIWRRRQPLVVWCLGAAGICAQALASHRSAEGLETLAVLCVGSYSVAAYARRRDAFIGLGVLGVTYTIFTVEDANFRTGQLSEQWAAAFFGLLSLACWLAGYVVHSRRLASTEALRAVALEHDREQVLADERARIARELHDIVSHNLSVVVLQASGARARGDGGDVDSTLEKIESSGRTALLEMRRMLGVLRAEDTAPALSPQPGIADLRELVDTVSRTGLPVGLDLADDLADLPPTVALSAYRIVQEALTNTLKHANASRADVSIRRADGVLIVEVKDASAHPTAPVTSVTPGHGLTGMKERAVLLGGELIAGWDATGFVVRARLPIAPEQQ
jgi:signal transduction histidine kinase